MKGAIPTLLVCGGLLVIAFFEGWGAVGAWWTRMNDRARKRSKEMDQ